MRKVETVVFVDPEKPTSRAEGRKEGPETLSRGQDGRPKLPKELDMKKTRWEVMKFASRRGEEKEDLLLQLGARKEKRKAVNYKILMEERKKQKAAAAEAKLSELQKPKLSTKKKTKSGNKGRKGRS